MSTTRMQSPPPMLFGYILAGLAWVLAIPGFVVFFFGGALWLTQAGAGSGAHANANLSLAVIIAAPVFILGTVLAFKARHILDQKT